MQAELKQSKQPLSAGDPGTLRRVPLFKALSDGELDEILKSDGCFTKTYPNSSLIIREGEIGDCMYIILSGVARVMLRKENTHRTEAVATLHQGDFFGEEALFPWNDGRRNASVRATGDTIVLHIDKQYVLHGLERGVEQLCSSRVFTSANLNNLSDLHIKGRGERESQLMVDVPRTEGREVLSILSACRIFKMLPESKLEHYKDWSKIQNYKMDEFIVQASDTVRYLYLVLDGIVEVLHADLEYRLYVSATLEKGSHFGELALVFGKTEDRKIYVRAKTDCSVLLVPAKIFRFILRRDKHLLSSFVRAGEQQSIAVEAVSET